MIYWCDQVKKILNDKLQQICCLAKLAMMAPDEAARNMVLQFIGEQLSEIKFWSHVLCIACESSPCNKGSFDTGLPPGVPISGHGPDMDAGTEAGQETGAGPVLGKPCPYHPGVTCSGQYPGMPCSAVGGGPCLVEPGPGIGIGPSIGTSPGENIGSDFSGGPGMSPGPGMLFSAGKGPGGVLGPGTSFGPKPPSFGGGSPIFKPVTGAGTSSQTGPITSGGPVISPHSAAPEAAAEKDKEPE